MHQNTKIETLLYRISSLSDEKSFERLFNLFAPVLYQFSYSFIKNNSLVQEIVSDVFLKVWINRKTLVSIDNIKAYLYKATYNTTINYIKKERQHRVVSIDDIEIPMAKELMNPETILINRELKNKIFRSIDRLPNRCKLIYKLAKVDELKYKEIAEMLDISVKTIDNQLAIAIKKIADEIANYLDEQGRSEDLLLLLLLFVPNHR